MSCIKQSTSLGEQNPFYGKHHSEEGKKKTGHYLRSDAQKEQARKQLEKVSNHRSVLDCWIDKYGEEEANKLWKEKNQKHRINAAGCKNNMFGKSSPNGSGNGWSGWYKGFYFRSLRELSFLIVFLPLNIVISAESNLYKIPYIDPLNQPRNYFPDYILNNKYIIEIKPKKLWHSPTIVSKSEAAIKYCINNKLIYKLYDPTIKTKLIKREYSLGEIKFLPKYEIKFKEWK